MSDPQNDPNPARPTVTAEAAEDAAWWATEIIDMAPGVIRYRGYAIEELIGRVSFAQMIWLLLRGDLPDEDQAELLDIALMSAVDHGPQAPSIAIARMAATCGVGLNNAVASAVNVLGDVHGGAGEQAMALYQDTAGRMEEGAELVAAVEAELANFAAGGGRFLPGFGHRFHPIDPRVPRLLDMVDVFAEKGAVSRAAGPRPVLPLPLRGNPGPCLGRIAVGPAQQGADPARPPVALRRAARTAGAGPRPGRSLRRRRSARSVSFVRFPNPIRRLRADPARPRRARRGSSSERTRHERARNGAVGGEPSSIFQRAQITEKISANIFSARNYIESY